MAGKTRPMSQIKQMIRLHQQGYAIKAIARSLSISKNTVKSYLYKIGEAKLNMTDLLALEDPVLEGLLHSGNPAYRDPRFEDLKERLPHLEKELKRVGVTRKLLWEEYKVSYPQGYGYSQFCYHFSQLSVSARSGTMVMQHEPADKLYIDFSGKKLHYIDIETGELINCEVFVACLPYSNYCYAKAVRSQTIPNFIGALNDCLWFLGGVPKALVPDNLKSAVTKSDRYEPDINRSMEDLANHYDTVVVPARAGKPRDKSAVENHVKIVYTQVFARLRNRRFFDLESLNEAITSCVDKLNQTRMQNRSYCRQERFISSEKHLLGKLPVDRFELKHYAELKVADNGHIYLGRDRHSYSVPYIHRRQKAQVVYTDRMVYIFVQGNQVAVHQRSQRANSYSTNPEHLESSHREYMDISPEKYRKKASGISPSFGQLITAIFEQKGRYPEQLYRTCDGLFRLQGTYAGPLFDKACNIAVENRMFSSRSIGNMLASGLSGWTEPEESEVPMPQHTNIRGAGYYS